MKITFHEKTKSQTEKSNINKNYLFLYSTSCVQLSENQSSNKKVSLICKHKNYIIYLIHNFFNST